VKAKVLGRGEIGDGTIRSASITAEASGIRVHPRTSQNDGTACPIVCLLTPIRGVRPRLVRQLLSVAGHVSEEGAKAISGDDGDVIVPILTISQSASSMTH
jgi:hypothetical protein